MTPVPQQIECLSDGVLESLVSGRLDAAEAGDVEEHLQSCAACVERTRSLAASDTLVAMLPQVGRVAWNERDEADTRRLIARLSDRSQLMTLSGSMEVTLTGKPAEAGPSLGATEPQVPEGKTVAAPAASAGAGDPDVTAAPRGTDESASSPTSHTVVLNPVAGAMLGAYRLESKLGEGGMGAVWKAFHTKLKKHVALKVLPAHLLRDAGLVARFEREMEAVGRLDHPAIVRAMDAGEVQGTHYLVMEYVEGQDLGQLVKSRGPRKVPEACEMIRQAAVGLAYAHRNGMVHRDIKPSNLFLAKPRMASAGPSAGATIKILDLGLARLQGDNPAGDPGAGLTGTGQVLGTPDYMAPEQWENTHTVGPACDLYALGCTLFFLLTGRAPYADDKHQTLPRKMMGHMEGAIPDLAAARRGSGFGVRGAGDEIQGSGVGGQASGKSGAEGIPPEVDAIYRRLMAKDPAARFASADELAAALMAVVKGTKAKPQSEADASVASVVPADLRSEISDRKSQISDFKSQITNVKSQISDPKSSSSAPPLPRYRANADAPRSPLPPRTRLALAALSTVILAGVIVITIRNRDGSETRIEVPDTSSVTISRPGENNEPRRAPKGGATDANAGWYGWPADAPKPAIAPFDAAQAKKHQEEWAAYLNVPVEYTDSFGMKFLLVPPGEFLMGAAENEVERLSRELQQAGATEYDTFVARSSGPRHTVRITKPFYLSQYEATVGQYRAFIEASRHIPSMEQLKVKRFQWQDSAKDPDAERRAVIGVSWDDAQAFCEWSGRQQGYACRLPTEAEWEFACRAGTTTLWSFGDDVTKLAEHAVHNRPSPWPAEVVGSKQPNPFGFHDQHGNADEWCLDWHDSNHYGKGPENDPAYLDPPTDKNSGRVSRGGSATSAPWSTRSAIRAFDFPATPTNPRGFRPTLTVESVRKALPKPELAGWHGWPADAPKPAIAPFDAAQAKRHQEEWAAYLKIPVERTNSIGMRFVLIPPGEFRMGSTPEEIEETLKQIDPNDKSWQETVKSEAPQHKVILTQPIYLGATEVTQAEYEKVMGKNPSTFAKTGTRKEHVEKVEGLDTSSHPVEGVSWNDAAEFCTKLSQQEKLKPFYFRAGETVTPLDGTGYRLPTEAEWEFTCRAGTTTKFWIGDTDNDLIKAGWFANNSGGRTHAAGELKANPFGLFDIHGNVYEWVQDAWDPMFYGQFQEKPAVNPIAPSSASSQRVFRGGLWRHESFHCRSSLRFSRGPTHRHYLIGFRVSLAAVGPRVQEPAIPNSPANASVPQPSTPNPRPSPWPADAPKPAIAPFDAARARKHQEEWAAYLKIPVEKTNSIGMKFVLIPPGEFTMGSTPEEIEETLKQIDPNDKSWRETVKSESPQHKVILTQPIYLGATEVTQSEYERVMGRNRSFFAKSGPNKQWVEKVEGLDTSAHPVENVSWNDAAEFCAKLSQQEKLEPFYFRVGETVTSREGTGYRLPTEAEWEFSCRAGTTTSFWIGDKDEDLMTAGWFGVHSGGRTHAAGELKSNPFGVFDIHGNVWEWVQDAWNPTFYAQFQEKPAIDPIAPTSAGFPRVFRGGVWGGEAFHCRSSGRRALDPSSRDVIGFRVSLVAVGSRAGGSTKPSESSKPTEPRPDAKTSAAMMPSHSWPADTPKPAIAPFDAAQAKRHQEEWAKYLKVPVEYTNSIGMKFRLVPPGEYAMGGTPEEIEETLKQIDAKDKRWQECVKSEGPQRRVILTRPIYLGVTEVTQGEYEKVIGRNPSFFAKTGPDKAHVNKVDGLDTAGHPVEGVSWNDAAEFCAKLSVQEKQEPFYSRTGETVTPLDGTGYRLPTEAEWEFSCRAGTTTKFWSGDKTFHLIQAGWFVSNSGGRTHAAGELSANPFGLRDIHGNVLEWVQDGWDPTYFGQFREKPAIDPSAPFDAGSQHVVRGGHWKDTALRCRSSDRDAAAPTYRHYFIGFRVALPVDAVRQALKVEGPAIPKGSATVFRPSGLDPRPAIVPMQPKALGTWEVGPEPPWFLEAFPVETRYSLKNDAVLPGVVERARVLPGVRRWNVDTVWPRGLILTARWSPNGKWIASGGTDGHVRVHEASTLKLRSLLPGAAFSNGVLDLCWHPDSERLAFVGESGLAVRVATVDGKIEWEFADADKAISCIQWNGAGTRVAIGYVSPEGEDRRVVEIRDAAGSIVRGISVDSNAGVPAGGLLWNPVHSVLAVRHLDGKLRIVNAETGSSEAIDTVGLPGPHNMAWSRQGWLAVATGENVRIYDPDRKRTQQIAVAASRVAWNPDGTRVFCAGENGTSVRDRDSGAEIGSIDESILDVRADGASLAVHGGYDKFLFSGLRIVVSDRAVPPLTALLGRSPVQSLSWSADGQLLASASMKFGHPRLWDFGGLQRRVWPEAVAARSRHAVFSPRTNDLLLGPADDPAQGLWRLVSIREEGEPQTWLESEPLGESSEVSWSGDGQMAAVGGTGGIVLIFDRAGTAIARMTTGSRQPAFVAWNRVKNRIAVVSDGQPLQFCDPEKGWTLRAVGSQPVGGNRAIWSPDGTRLCVQGQGWFDAEGRRIADPGRWHPLAWRPDSGEYVGFQGEMIALREPGGTVTRGHLTNGRMVSFAWHPQGSLIAAGTSQSTITAWRETDLQPHWHAVLLPDGKAATFSAAGELIGGKPEEIDPYLVYCVEREAGKIETLTPAEFRKLLP